jgi:hypothetical protein
MARLGGKINGATENIERASIYVRATQPAQLLIKPLWTAPAQIGDAMDAQIGQVSRDARAYTRNALKVTQIGSVHSGLQCKLQRTQAASLNSDCWEQTKLFAMCLWIREKGEPVSF